MQHLRQLIIEAHRRSLWQVLGIYVFGAWAAYEIIAEVTDRMGMPEWVPGFAIVLFLIGLPIVLATAFVQEGLPGQSAVDAGPADPTLVPGLELQDARGERRAPQPVTRGRPHVFLTWQRSVLAGITAFLLLGLTASSYMGLRHAGVGPFASLLSAGTLDERDRIIVAQLRHTAGDSITADAVTEALRVDLGQSRIITIMEQRYLGEALMRMGRERDARLTSELAREVGIREGVKAVLEGEVAPAGSRFVITTRLVHAGTGELLLSRRETANDADDIIGAVDRLSQKLRADIGESLRAVRADPRLEAVTTPSLVALQKYTQALRAMDLERDYDRAIPLLREAVAADSTFAMAWRKLAVAYYNTFGGRNNLMEAITRAFELRARLTERERYHMTAFYHLNITGETGEAIAAYRSLLDSYPDDHAALNNLALSYGRLHENRLAADYYRRALAVDSFTVSTWTNLAMTEYKLGNSAEAARLLDEVRQRFPQQRRDDLAFRAQFAHAERDYEEMEQHLTAMAAETRGSDYWRSYTNFLQAHARMMQGRLTDARRHFGVVLEANVARGISDARLWDKRTQADLATLILQRPEEGIAKLDAIVASDDWRDATPDTRNYMETALSYARAGAAAPARRLLNDWRALPATERTAPPAWIEPSVEGWIAMAEDRPADATQSFREASATGECMICGLWQLGFAYEQLGVADSALAYYRRYIETPQMTRMYDDAWELALAYERLAELYAHRGDTRNAAHYGGLFVRLWERADPELQPRVRRMQALLQRTVER